MTVQGVFLMEINASGGPFGFTMAVPIGSTRGPTSVNKLAVSALQRILTPLFIAIDMFDLVVPYLFSV